MAGAGYKLFNTGDVLTASDVNTYLQQQVVMVFASAAARTSALSGVLAEGMVTYLQDTNSVQVYNGTAFVAVGGSSPVTTKGDLYTFSTVDARLGVGANGTTLVADSAEATGLKWAAPAGGGKVLQVVQATHSTATSTTGSSFVTTGLTADITPSLATSKILILISQPFQVTRASGTTDMGGGVQIYKGASAIFGGTDTTGALYLYLASHSGQAFLNGRTNLNFLDSPATTSLTTYTSRMISYGATNTITAQPNSLQSSIILMEVGA